MATLLDAINGVEAAQTQLTNDQQIQSSAAGNVTAAQAKLDSASSAKTTADATVTADVSAFNSSLDNLIAAANAAKL